MTTCQWCGYDDDQGHSPIHRALSRLLVWKTQVSFWLRRRGLDDDA